jgi:NAD(P)-dependent dehydrogenase (short-subunit alcohol dehydrogenase family)
MQTNYYGSKQVIKAMLPILRSTDCAGPRILIVASRSGQLKALENNFREKSLDREHITEAYIDNFVNKYLDEVKSGAWEGGGWPDWTKWGWISPMPTYSVSKIALIAYSSVLHQAFSTQPAAAGQQKVCIFSYCPGNVKTDMNDHRGKLSVEEGADTGVWLVLQCPKGSSGKFWAERQEMDF